MNGQGSRGDMPVACEVKRNASALPAELLMSQLTCQPKLVVLV